jgi:hypothetical protein
MWQTQNVIGPFQLIVEIDQLLLNQAQDQMLLVLEHNAHVLEGQKNVTRQNHHLAISLAIVPMVLCTTRSVQMDWHGLQ